MTMNDEDYCDSPRVKQNKRKNYCYEEDDDDDNTRNKKDTKKKKIPKRRAQRLLQWQK